MEKSFDELVQIRNQYAIEEKKLYLNYATKLNSLSDEALRTDYARKFADGCIQDIIGQMIRNFFPLTDTYVTADQLLKRVITFTYQTDYDPLFEKEGVRTLAYNYDEVQGISEFVNGFNVKLKLDRGIYVDGERSKLPDYRKKALVNQETNTVVDDLTGKTRPDQIPEGNNGRTTASLEGDHKVPIAEASVNEEFTKDIQAYSEEAERIYNDKDNIWYIDEKANNIKSDLADPENIIQAWENATAEQKEVLRQRGILDENDEVPEYIKNRLRAEIRNARKTIEYRSDLNQLRNLDYASVGKHGFEKTVGAIPKIVAGQILYYMLPPVVYETKCAILTSKENGVNIDSVIQKLNKASKRIIDYTLSHVGVMFGNLTHNTVKQFFRTVFDIVISLLKSYIRHFVQIAKTITISVLDSIRIIAQPGTDKMQKADAVTNLFVLGLTNTLLDIAFEYLELQGIPAEITEVVQVLASVVVSNLVFILMEKLDLFDVHYGFKIAKLEQIFANVSTEYTADRLALQSRTQEEIDLLKNDLLQQIESFKKDLETKDFYAEDVFEDVERINRLFNMNISFTQEWDAYIQAPAD